MATRNQISRRLASAAAACAALGLLGCGGTEDSVNGFTAQTSSKDKQEIAATVTPAGQPVPAAATPSPKPPTPLSEPVVATKMEETVAAIREEADPYRAGNRRDPFRSLVTGETKSAELVDLSVVTLVGICWDGSRTFCAVEDAEGVSFILRKGDRVKNGRVVGIRNGALVASQTILGFTTTVQLELDTGEDGIHG